MRDAVCAFHTHMLHRHTHGYRLRAQATPPPAHRGYISSNPHNKLTLNLLNPDTYPEAVCNDGTPGAYWFAPGAAGNTQWLIYLQGGMWCYSEATCGARYQAGPFFMSSAGLPEQMNMGGVFSDNPENPWASANKIYAAYCSSDGWAGDVGASAATFGWNFRGQQIIAAIVADLVARQGLAGGADVLFGGCSAGARGAMVNLDFIQPMLPAGCTLRGLLDSGLWLDLNPPDTAEDSLQAQTQAIYALVNPAARIPAACAAQYAGQAWKCLYGQVSCACCCCSKRLA